MTELQLIEAAAKAMYLVYRKSYGSGPRRWDKLHTRTQGHLAAMAQAALKVF